MPPMHPPESKLAEHTCKPLFEIHPRAALQGGSGGVGVEILALVLSFFALAPHAWAEEGVPAPLATSASAELEPSESESANVAKAQPAGSQNARTDAAEPDVLRVGVAGSAPFVIRAPGAHSTAKSGAKRASKRAEPRDADAVEGIALSLWEQIADAQRLEYRAEDYGENVSEALAAIRRGDLDVVVGPTSITAHRVQDIRFSQPYYQAGVSILSKASDAGIWGRLKPLFSLQLLIGIGVLLLILGGVGTLIWLAERKESPEQFPPDPARGIANGMWCAIVTMSTTGYGDLAPKTLQGRVIAGAWMIISLLFATTMVAGIASTLTLSGIQNLSISKAEHLRNRRVAVAPDSPASRFVTSFGGQPTAIETLEEGYTLLKRDKVDAVVFDRPQMLYFLRLNPDEDVAASSAEYIRRGYGFAFAPGSQLVHAVDVEMLRIKEDGALTRIIEPWLGDELH